MRVGSWESLAFFLLFTLHCSLFTLLPAFAASQAEAPKAVAGQKAEVEKEEGLIQLLEKKKKELDSRESELNEREARLNLVGKEVERKIAKLGKLREEIEGHLKRLNAIDAQNTEHLIKIYESMPPKDAAARIEQLDEDTAILVLSKMKQRTAGKVMSFIEPGRAAELSKGLVRRFKAGK